MAIFEQYREYLGEYEVATINMLNAQNNLSYSDGIINIMNELRCLNNDVKSFNVAKKNLLRIMDRIISSSAISLHEAEVVFPQLFDHRFEVTTIKVNDKKYLSLYPGFYPSNGQPDDKWIVLGYEDENKKFNLYKNKEDNNIIGLENFEIYNYESDDLRKLVDFTNLYIEHKSKCSVDNLIEFFYKFYSGGEFNLDTECEDIVYQHEMDKRRYTKRRRADYFSKIRRQSVAQKRLEKKIDTHLLPEKYQNK